MKIAQIEAFVAVAETGSIGSAAARLGLSQPAVTRQLQQLETSLGVALLDRRTKPPTLTSAGRMALKHARQLLCSRDDLLDSLNDAASLTGTFRLGVAFGAADFVLQQPIDTLRKTFPDLKVEVLTNWSRTLMMQTRSGVIDAAVVLTEKGLSPPTELDKKALHTDDIVVVAHNDLPVDGTLPIQALADFDWVMNPKGCWYRDLLQDSMGRHHVPLKVAIETFGIEFQLSLIARGVGLGLIPAWAVACSNYKDQIKTLNIAEHHYELTVWTIRNSYLDRFADVIDTLETSIIESIA